MRARIQAKSSLRIDAKAVWMRHLDHITSEARIPAETLKVSLLKVAGKRIFLPLRPEQVKGSIQISFRGARGLGFQRDSEGFI